MKSWLPDFFQLYGEYIAKRKPYTQLDLEDLLLNFVISINYEEI